MENRVITLAKTTYWPACDNKNQYGKMNEEVIGGVPAGVEGVLIYRYQVPVLRDDHRKLTFWEFVPNDSKYLSFGGGKYMTIDDHLYNAYLEAGDLPGGASH